VCLNVTSEFAKMILDATPGGIECIADRDSQIIGLLPVDRDLRSRQTEIDPHVERASFSVVMNRRFNHDVASGEPRVIQLKVFGAFADLCFHSRRQLKIT
jgi:hypothetical protein